MARSRKTKAWISENLRCTAFLHAPSALNEQWWESLVGGKPEAKHSRPQDNFLAVTGPIFGEKCNLSLTGTGDRVDWLLTGRDDPKAGEDRPFPFAGSFDERVKQFQTLISKWLPAAPSLKRLAFGGVAVCPVEDIAEGLQVLKPLLPSIELAPDSLDFAYAINRPRRSESIGSNLKINRLSKWNVMTLQRVRLVATLAPGVSEMQQTALGGSQNVARIEIDINTAAEFQGELPGGKLPALLSELMNLGLEIVEKGDLP
jgi:hypothetical protein